MGNNNLYQQKPQDIKLMLAEINDILLRNNWQNKHITIMEVCGTHTHAIAKAALKKILPSNINLISGPGCPVCVTPADILAFALALAKQEQIVISTFGDMLKVPLADNSLLKMRGLGANIHLATSPLDALNLAKAKPNQQIVFLAVGFETTAPLTAAAVKMAAEQGIANFSIINGHRLMPQALRALLAANHHLDGLLCPGHVAAVTGAAYFDFVAEELAMPAAIAGFEPPEIMLALKNILQQMAYPIKKVANCYPLAVKEQGSPIAKSLLEDVFSITDGTWRGLGQINGSALKLNDNYAAFAAENRFKIEYQVPPAQHGCACGAILRGEMLPRQCKLFGKFCHPGQPLGACMVSHEGSCAAAYHYEGGNL